MESGGRCRTSRVDAHFGERRPGMQAVDVAGAGRGGPLGDEPCATGRVSGLGQHACHRSAAPFVVANSSMLPGQPLRLQHPPVPGPTLRRPRRGAVGCLRRRRRRTQAAGQSPAGTDGAASLARQTQVMPLVVARGRGG
jgi:hypothetical protein